MATAKACFSEKMEEFSPKNTPCAIAHGTVAVLPTNNPITSSSVGYLVCDTIKINGCVEFSGLSAIGCKDSIFCFISYRERRNAAVLFEIMDFFSKIGGCDYARMRGNR